MEQIQQFFTTNMGTTVLNFIVAFLILIIGYVLARIIASIVRRVLMRTDLDNRLADTLSEPGAERRYEIEDIIAKIVFWLLMIAVIVAFLDRLNLDGISQPLSLFLNELTSVWLPRIGYAALLLFIAWLLATALRFLFVKGANLLKLDERLGHHAALKDEEQVSFTKPISLAIFWFVFLLFLPAVMDALGITAVAEPLQLVFTQLLSYLPNILGAIVIGIIGWLLARIIRQIVEGILKAVGTDGIGHRMGLPEDRSLSDVIGTVIYVVILLVVIISALDALDIAAISDPATAMLTTIIDAVPNIIGAALILILAYFIGRLVTNLVRELLGAVGFNDLPRILGIEWSATRTPADWASWLLLVVIMIFAATAAVEMLGSSFLVGIMDVFIDFLWKLFLAVVVFAFGLYFANLAYRLVLATGSNNALFMARMSRIIVIAFAAAIALRELGIADDIINLAFGLTLGAVALAVALAFGLGGRELAGNEAQAFLNKMRAPDDSAAAPPAVEASTGAADDADAA